LPDQAGYGASLFDKSGPTAFAAAIKTVSDSLNQVASSFATIGTQSDAVLSKIETHLTNIKSKAQQLWTGMGPPGGMGGGGGGGGGPQTGQGQPSTTAVAIPTPSQWAGVPGAPNSWTGSAPNLAGMPNYAQSASGFPTMQPIPPVPVGSFNPQPTTWGGGGAVGGMAAIGPGGGFGPGGMSWAGAWQAGLGGGGAGAGGGAGGAGGGWGDNGGIAPGGGFGPGGASWAAAWAAGLAGGGAGGGGLGGGGLAVPGGGFGGFPQGTMAGAGGAPSGMGGLAAESFAPAAAGAAANLVSGMATNAMQGSTYGQMLAARGVGTWQQNSQVNLGLAPFAQSYSDYIGGASTALQQMNLVPGNPNYNAAMQSATMLQGLAQGTTFTQGMQAYQQLMAPQSLNQLQSLGIQISPGGQWSNLQGAFNAIIRRIAPGGTQGMTPAQLSQAMAPGTPLYATAQQMLGNNPTLMQAFMQYFADPRAQGANLATTQGLKQANLWDPNMTQEARQAQQAKVTGQAVPDMADAAACLNQAATKLLQLASRVEKFFGLGGSSGGIGGRILSTITGGATNPLSIPGNLLGVGKSVIGDIFGGGGGGGGSGSTGSSGGGGGGSSGSGGTGSSSAGGGAASTTAAITSMGGGTQNGNIVLASDITPLNQSGAAGTAWSYSGGGGYGPMSPTGMIPENPAVKGTTTSTTAGGSGSTGSSTAGPTGNAPAGGSYTQTTWAQAFLKAINAPATPANMASILHWEDVEGGNWKNTAKYNPLNTTYQMPGSVNYNTGQPGGGVQSYTSWQSGLQATIDTIKLSYYTEVLAALQQGIGLSTKSYPGLLTWSGNSYSSMARGSMNVDRTQLALLHKGERVIPAAENYTAANKYQRTDGANGTNGSMSGPVVHLNFKAGAIVLQVPPNATPTDMNTIATDFVSALSQPSVLAAVRSS
jgi:hypothetical protein